MSRAERIDGPPPRTRNNRSVGSAAVVQSDLDEGRCKQADSTSQTQREAPPRPKVDLAKINSFMRLDHLSRTWTVGNYRGPWFFPPLPNMAIKLTGLVVAAGECPRYRLDWFDPIAGVGGANEISLAAHVLKVSEDEAAWRLARWFAAKNGIDIACLLAKEQANG